MRALAAVDLGAQSGRVALGRFDGAAAVSEVARFANVPVQVQGRLQWDVLRLYADVLDGLRAAAREAGTLDAVGVDLWAVDVGLLDARGRLLQNPVHYRDARRAGAVEAGARGCPRASCTSAPASSSCRSTPSSSWPRWPPSTIPSSTRRRASC